MDADRTRDCPYCTGSGCSECSGTGQRVTTYLSDGDMHMRVAGNAPLSPEMQAALVEIGRAAIKHVSASPSHQPEEGDHAR